MIRKCCIDLLHYACGPPGRGQGLRAHRRVAAPGLTRSYRATDEETQAVLVQKGLTVANAQKVLKRLLPHLQKSRTGLADRIDQLKVMFSLEALNDLARKSPEFILHSEPATVAVNVQTLSQGLCLPVPDVLQMVVSHPAVGRCNHANAAAHLATLSTLLHLPAPAVCKLILHRPQLVTHSPTRLQASFTALQHSLALSPADTAALVTRNPTLLLVPPASIPPRILSLQQLTSSSTTDIAALLSRRPGLLVFKPESLQRRIVHLAASFSITPQQAIAQLQSNSWALAYTACSTLDHRLASLRRLFLLPDGRTSSPLPFKFSSLVTHPPTTLQSHLDNIVVLIKRPAAEVQRRLRVMPRLLTTSPSVLQAKWRHLEAAGRQHPSWLHWLSSSSVSSLLHCLGCSGERVERVCQLVQWGWKPAITPGQALLKGKEVDMTRGPTRAWLQQECVALEGAPPVLWVAGLMETDPWWVAAEMERAGAGGWDMAALEARDEGVRQVVGRVGGWKEEWEGSREVRWRCLTLGEEGWGEVLRESVQPGGAGRLEQVVERAWQGAGGGVGHRSAGDVLREGGGCTPTHAAEHQVPEPSLQGFNGALASSAEFDKRRSSSSSSSSSSNRQEGCAAPRPDADLDRPSLSGDACSATGLLSANGSAPAGGLGRGGAASSGRGSAERMDTGPGRPPGSLAGVPWSQRLDEEGERHLLQAVVHRLLATYAKTQRVVNAEQVHQAAAAAVTPGALLVLQHVLHKEPPKVLQAMGHGFPRGASAFAAADRVWECTAAVAALGLPPQKALECCVAALCWNPARRSRLLGALPRLRRLVQARPDLWPSAALMIVKMASTKSKEGALQLLADVPEARRGGRPINTFTAWNLTPGELQEVKRQALKAEKARS